eukprot:TRINITY_DN10912_c0_g1_i1.p1 TRINITY_DN10912_c0_g1~~TRINITY_DN10912_c0_g1_i1.p1  ORF type:complete len:182 (-),score=31.03 TRINITY_DN10912_c0_g1_i1:14-559(-)
MIRRPPRSTHCISSAASDVYKRQVSALRGINLDVRRGEFLCLMGPSGSGKTTILNILGGLDTPSRGHVIVDGQNVVSLDEEKLAALRLRKMGFVFQNFNLLTSFSALENVEVPMILIGKRNPKRAQDLLKLVGLGDRMGPVSYTHLRAHETRHDLVCRLLLEKKKQKKEETAESKLVREED